MDAIWLAEVLQKLIVEKKNRLREFDFEWC